MAVQDHPRSLILVPIENVHATSYWSSIVTLVLSSSYRDIASSFLKTMTHPILHQNFEGVPLGLDRYVGAPRSEDPKLIIRVITFEVTRHI